MPDVFNILDQGWANSNLLTTGEETVSRELVNSSTLPMTTQVMRLAYFTARKSETVSQVRVQSGGTAAGATPSLCRVGLYTVAANGDLTLVASTPNDTALFANTNTAYTKSFSAPYAKVAGQRYAMAILVVTAAAVPHVVANSVTLVGSETGQSPRLSGVSSQTDLAASIAAGAISDSSNRPYGVLLP